MFYYLRVALMLEARTQTSTGGEFHGVTGCNQWFWQNRQDGSEGGK
jgi:heat shock protein HslJ